jgi:predicted phosphodiesterase
MKSMKQVETLPLSLNKSPNNIKISGNHKTLVLADTHFPYQSNDAIKKAIDIGKQFKPDIVVFLGDIIDCVSISRFVKRMDERDFNTEIKATRRFLETTTRTFNGCKFYYLEGNHELRVSNYLLTHADALATLEELSLPSLLHLKEMNITFLPSDKILQIGKLTYTHGHLLKGTCSQFPARSLYMSAKTSAICGHAHRESAYTCRAITGEIFKTYSIGCLATLTPSYSAYNDFTAGCATITTDNVGKFDVQLKSF